MEDDNDDPPSAAGGTPPQSLLPYDAWTEAAQRQVVLSALDYAAEHGLPGGPHFYVTFRTDHPGVVVPNRLRAQYPQEMTIVLQHQFWDLRLDREAALFSVGLSFGGVPATLVVPFEALTAFADPQVQYALRFAPPPPAEIVPEPEPEPAPAPEPAGGSDQVISLDAFRRRTPPGK